MHEGWKQAKPIDKYYKAGVAQGEKFSAMRARLTYIETQLSGHGEWNLYVDEECKYWEDYCQTETTRRPLYKYELVVVWDTKEKSIYEYETRKEAERAGEDWKMAFGEQVWYGVREKL